MVMRVALILGVVLASSASAQQEHAPLMGVVADEVTGELIDSATVTLVGKGRETRTFAGGVFQFEEIGLGRHLVRVHADGYPAVMEEAELTADAALIVQILLPNARAILQGIGVVVEPTDRAPTEGSTTAADLLALQSPGIYRSSGDVGERTNRVLLRGVGSISLSSEPAIFVNGVQITTSGRVMDILSQIPASDVKSVQIQRGPAAAFLDGKANGAIHIVTRGGADDSRRQ
jgi:hypothetical protein